MGNSRRWKEWISWWREISPKVHLYPPEILARMINDKVYKIQRKKELEDTKMDMCYCPHPQQIKLYNSIRKNKKFKLIPPKR